MKNKLPNCLIYSECLGPLPFYAHYPCCGFFLSELLYKPKLVDSVDFIVLFLTDLALTFLPPLIQQYSLSSAQCFPLSRCICFHQFLDQSIRIAESLDIITLTFLSPVMFDSILGLWAIHSPDPHTPGSARGGVSYDMGLKPD